MRTESGGKQVTGFTLAINKRFKTKAGEKKEKTAFIVCSYRKFESPGRTINGLE
jgi:single-strand DNA-binding protein